MSNSRHLLLALTQPVEGKEDAFNAWYDAHHVPECVQVNGFKSGQRFKLSASNGESPSQAYLALYELEGDDPRAILDGLLSTRDRRIQSDAIDRDKTLLWVFSEIGEKHEADD
ncbi:MAG: DUF4286 family protein [Alphaproteobacteria bacterium]